MNKVPLFILVSILLATGCITTAGEPSGKVDVKLDELTPVKMKSATAAKKTQVNKNCTGGPLKIGEVTYVQFGETYYQPIQVDGQDMYEIVEVREEK